jgi:hypothetical protein
VGKEFRLGCVMAQVDREGKGSLTPEAITLFLDDLGLEPTSYDVKLIMEELDPRQEGMVTRSDFMDFIRNGGRRQRPQKAVPIQRRLSIELDADKLEAGQHPSSSWTQSHLEQTSEEIAAVSGRIAFSRISD